MFGLYVTDFSQSFTEGDLRRRPVTPGPVCASIDRAAGTFSVKTFTVSNDRRERRKNPRQSHFGKFGKFTGLDYQVR